MANEKYVKLSKVLIEEIFTDCNVKYFNNEVKPPKYIQLFTPNKRTLGMVRPCYDNRAKKWVSALHISRLYNWTRENLEKVIIHEMIHLYIEDYLTPLIWWERWLPFRVNEHNEEFIEVMNTLNSRYELDIKVRFKEMRAYFKRPRR